MAQKSLSGSEIEVYCVSWKRPDKVKTVAVFGKGLILAVAESEAKQYAANYPGLRVFPIPDEVEGNISRVRNYVLDNAGEFVLMVDDDLKCVGMTEHRKQRALRTEEVWDLLAIGFQMCLDAKTILWGINIQSDPMWYNDYSPFSFLSPALGPWQCHVNTKPRKTRFDEVLDLKEDYDYSLQVLRLCKRILRFNKYYYLVDHLDQAGGCAAYRTMERERLQLVRLKEKWGDAVRINMKRSVNPILNPPLKGI